MVAVADVVVAVVAAEVVVEGIIIITIPSTIIKIRIRSLSPMFRLL